MIAVVDYGVGNLRSIANALDFLGASFQVTRDPGAIQAADKIILPGVGAFAAGMRNLYDFGLVDVLRGSVLSARKPILGICLGLQLFAEKGLEDGEHPGLGWIPGVIRRIPPEAGLKIPHMGWDETFIPGESRLLKGIASGTPFYYVHSYYLDCPAEEVSSFCEYGVRIPATWERGNIFGTQFHPEKSQDGGLRLLKNFCEMEGKGA